MQINADMSAQAMRNRTSVSPKERLPARETVRRPIFLPIVVFGNRGPVGGQNHPGLLAGGKNVYVRGKQIRLI